MSSKISDGISKKRVFVTSLTFDGNMGGLTGADTNCQTAANTATLGGTWKAWLSDATTNAISRLSNVGPWYLVDNTTIAVADYSDLSTSGATVTITQDELGNPSVGTIVWTSTNGNGVKLGATFCTDWSSNSGVLSSRIGLSGGAGAAWTTSGVDTCDMSYSLYCFEQ